MDHALQVALTEQIFHHIDGNTTSMALDLTQVPIDTYTCPDRLRREQSILFRRYPLVAGLTCQLREPGDYVTTDYLGLPILVARGNDGEVRAFLNVCRHRGSKVARDCGRVRRVFSCPYHGWSYALDGSLVHVPHEEAFEGLDRTTRGLRPLPAAERYGMIWVHPSAGSVVDVEAHLEGLGPELASYGLEHYHHYETRVLEQPINWKIAIDTFLEPYHFAILHRETVAPLLIHNLCLFEPFGPNLREVLPRHTIEELRAQPQSTWDLIKHTAIVYVLFPNTVFVMQLDHVELWRMYPLQDRVDRCIMTIDFLIPEPAMTDKARGHWDRNMDLVIRTVLEEDFTTGATIQSGLTSGAQDHLTLGRNEPALAHFEKSVAAALAR